MSADSHIIGDVSPALLTIPHRGYYLDRAATEHGEATAIVSVHQRCRYTYQELRDEANRTARALIAAGVESGARVGLWSANCAEWLVGYHGIAKAGAIVVNLNPAYRAAELGAALQQTGVDLLIAARLLWTNECAESASRARVRRVVFLGTPDSESRDDWASFLQDGEAAPRAALEERGRAIGCDDPAVIMFTSGTTAAPKGETLSHRTIVNTGLCAGECLRLTPDDRICLPVPLYHCFGSIVGGFAAWLKRACAAERLFDAKKCLEASRGSANLGVPIFSAQVDHPMPMRSTSLRTGVMAGRLSDRADATCHWTTCRRWMIHTV